MTTLTLDLEDALSEKSQTLVLYGEGLQTIRISIESSAPLEHLKTMDGPL